MDLKFAQPALKATLAVIATPFVLGVLHAQTPPPAPAYTYEVVSIHKSNPSDVNVHIGPGPHGGLETVNTSVDLLISAAYGVEKYQILGAPGWLSSSHYDVTFTPDKSEITPGSGTSPKDFTAYLNRNFQRLQAVLRDRFGLVLRAETRDLPIFTLTVAQRGSKLTPHPEAKPAPPSIQTNGPAQITTTNATMEMLAQQLSMQLGRPVHDETALPGRYDLKLEWTPDPNPAEPTPALGPSIFTAITEQLGLRLESKKGPVPVFIVEKIDRPAEN